MRRDASFVEYVDVRRAALVRTAYLLCGDWHRAEDLVQQVLVKLYAVWPRVVAGGREDAYVRRVLVNTHIDDWRRRGRRRETLVADAPDFAAVADGQPDGRETLRTALAALPEGQRKVVVLRFWLDLSVEQTASDLGVSVGTVKSQTSRAIAALRGALGATVEDDLKRSQP